MRQFTRWLAWRSNQPAIVRWLEALGLFVAALAARFWLGSLHGAIPYFSFYPAILLSAVLLGWQEALFVLGLSLAAGWYFFLPPGMVLLPAGSAFVGVLTIAIILALKDLAQQLSQANERQKVLFQELQHRVANTLQAAVGRLDLVRRKMDADPAGAAAVLDATIRRLGDSADMHRRLHDPSLLSRGTEPMLRDAVATVIDNVTINVAVHAEELPLSLDQMSIIAMLVIEIANNALKHVFRRKLGSRFEVHLRALPGNRAMLRTWDDGPGGATRGDATATEERLGQRILQGLVDQLRGTLRLGYDGGTEIVVEFPINRR